MRQSVLTLWTFYMLLSGYASAAEIQQIMQVPSRVYAWTAFRGEPVAYAARNGLYAIRNRQTTKIERLNSDVHLSLSPNNRYMLFDELMPEPDSKTGDRVSVYTVHDAHNQFAYKITRQTGADLKSAVAAISDDGILALVDPISAMAAFYRDQTLIAETQLYAAEGDYSLERNVRIQWGGDRCYILIERPFTTGGSGGNVLFISLDSDGRNQRTRVLPFRQVQQFLLKDGHKFISGYSYYPSERRMDPVIMEVSDTGETLWTHSRFGHELAVSESGKYLAARADHQTVVLFDLDNKRVSTVDFPESDTVALGLSVNNSGKIALIRVSRDFFVKKDTQAAQVILPQSGGIVDVQLDPNYPDLFHTYSDGVNFYLGTSYEWLEIW